MKGKEESNVYSEAREKPQGQISITKMHQNARLSKYEEKDQRKQEEEGTRQSRGEGNSPRQDGGGEK